MTPYDIDYEAVQARVEARLEREQKRSLAGLLIANSLIYGVFMILCWFVLPNATTNNLVVTGVMMVILLLLSVGWTCGLILHIVATLTALGMMQQSQRAQALAKELQAELTANPAKRKRADRLLLSEDGELLEITDDDKLAQRRA